MLESFGVDWQSRSTAGVINWDPPREEQTRQLRGVLRNAGAIRKTIGTRDLKFLRRQQAAI